MGIIMYKCADIFNAVYSSLNDFLTSKRSDEQEKELRCFVNKNDYRQDYTLLTPLHMICSPYRLIIANIQSIINRIMTKLCLILRNTEPSDLRATTNTPIMNTESTKDLDMLPVANVIRIGTEPAIANKTKNKKKEKQRKRNKPSAPSLLDKQKTRTSEANSKQGTSSASVKICGTNNSFPFNTSIVKDVERNKTSKNGNTPKKSSLNPSDVTPYQGGNAVTTKQNKISSSDSVLNDENWSKMEINIEGDQSKNDKRLNNGDSSVGSNGFPKVAKKKIGKTPSSRKRIANRKIVKDILSSILTSVDAEIAIKRKQQMMQVKNERRNKNEKREIAATNVSSSVRPSLLLDIVADEGHQVQACRNDNSVSVGNKDTQISKLLPSALNWPDDRSPPTKFQPLNYSIWSFDINADQGTVPTFSETMSGVSAHNFSRNNLGGSLGSQRNQSHDKMSSERYPAKSESHTLPVPDLFSGPRNAHSATSSVASSLEAPHGCEDQNSLGKEGVGYHLLSLCESLSNDLSTFMGRRSAAVNLRRRERGVLLTALQKIVSGIWIGQGQVELYGSCATQLDLPSSDLDTIICGLPRKKKLPKKKNRVLRLARALGKEPWVVQIKAIPTASVPVLKILADPAKLGHPGNNVSVASHGIGHMDQSENYPSQEPKGEWMIPATASHRIDGHQPVEIHSGVSLSSTKNLESNSVDPSLASKSTTQIGVIEPCPTLWRGADVMNGLIKMDITFEGPEHGGVGSTAYTTRVIEEASNETGLPPESTPLVQVTMVLKELLAQRRLNEPFSGGMSSYSLLLMVIAIIQDRKAMRLEMEDAKQAGLPQSKTVSSSSSWASIVMKTKTKPDQEPQKLKRPNPQWSQTKKMQGDSGIMDQNTYVQVPPIDNEKTMWDQKEHERVQSFLATTHSHPPTIKCPVNIDMVSGACAKQGYSSSFVLPQGSNDVLEVLCSGDATAGKLLMHFLLFYGQYFDAQSTVIDVTAPYRGSGPFAQRQTGAYMNHGTGMLSVDTIVVHNPLDGSVTERTNVAKSCIAWSSIRFVFAQCYTALQHAMERGGRNDGSAAGFADFGYDGSRLLELMVSF